MTTARVNVQMKAGETETEAHARAMLEPGIRHGAVALGFGAQAYGGQAPPALGSVVDQLRKTMDEAEAGGTATANRMLAAQAAALDAMFTELCRRAQLNANDFPDAAEKYIRLALKAQARCAATLETLAHIQRPGSEAPRHVTVADGGQAIIADQFHHHAGSQNGKTADQPHAPREDGASAPLLGENQDPAGWSMPGARSEGLKPVPNARRQGKRRAER